MPIIKKTIFFSVMIFVISLSKTYAENLKKMGKFKDWEVMVMSETSGKVCFAQSTPVLQAPKKIIEMQDYLLLSDLAKKLQMKLALRQVMNLIKITPF